MEQHIGKLVFYDASYAGGESIWVPGIVVGLHKGHSGKVVGCQIQWLWTTRLHKKEKLSWWEPRLLEKGYYSMWSNPFDVSRTL